MFGSQDAIYKLRVPQFPHPVYLRGGRSSDMWSLYELLVMNEYGLLGPLTAAQFIIDGGANIGLASVCFLNQYPDAYVVSVEPDPDNYALCEKNLAPYTDRVKLVRGAVWKSHDSLNLQAGEQEWTHHVSASADGGGTVEGYSMSSLISYRPGKVQILKLDIEGSEKAVFDTEPDAWLPYVENLVIELHGEECKESFFRALKGYDYDFFQEGYVVACRNLRRPEAAPYQET